MGVKADGSDEWVWFNPRYLCPFLGLGYNLLVPQESNQTSALIVDEEAVVGILMPMVNT